MDLQFSTLDVFTSTPFKGNPLAVVTIPPSMSETLSQAQKQAIAREFNLSETVFVHDSNDKADTERKIDIFTVSEELPFAGHPTIGSAIYLQAWGVNTLITKAGRIAIESVGDGSVRAAIPHNVRLHERHLGELLPPPNTSGPTVDAELTAPIFSIVKGMTFMLVELPSLELLGKVGPSNIDFRIDELLDDGWQDTFIARYYFVRTGTEATEGGEVHMIRTRMVEAEAEDPATGSAACALASYLSLHKLSGKSLSFQITQGVEMGRESNILVEVEVSDVPGDSRGLKTLHLGGKATKVMRGTIAVGGAGGS